MRMVMAAVLLISTLGVAQGREAAPAAGSGSDTRNWLELQRSGAQASARPQALSPAVAARAHQRWIESFERPIPETLLRERGAGEVR